MRVLTQTELNRLTKMELHALLRRTSSELPNLKEGSPELRNAHVNLRARAGRLSRALEAQTFNPWSLWGHDRRFLQSREVLDLPARYVKAHQGFEEPAVVLHPQVQEFVRNDEVLKPLMICQVLGKRYDSAAGA